MGKKRIKFDLRQRIRDHQDCCRYDPSPEELAEELGIKLYDENGLPTQQSLDPEVKRKLAFRGCLGAASQINAPRVCWEGCPLWIEPDPMEAKIIAELLENIQEIIPEEIMQELLSDGSDEDED